MKNFAKHIAPALLALLTVCGCGGMPYEEISPSDITIEELEQRMAEATDPHGRYRAAKSFVMKQVVENKSLFGGSQERMVETKFLRPNYFKITTYEDNQPMQAVITNGVSSWVVDYVNKKVKMLDAEQIRQFKRFNDITTPGSKLSAIFSDISVKKSRIGDNQYYKVSCSDGKNTILHVYIGADSCQIERVIIVTGGDVVYDSRLNGYGLYEGVRIPEETLVRSGGGDQLFKVIYCKLDVPLDISEFRPTVF